MGADKDGAYWGGLERVLEALMSLAPAESRPTSLRFALRHLLERLSYLEGALTFCRGRASRWTPN